MVRLVDKNKFAKSDDKETFLSNKENDCILYSEEGIEFNIHKEILCQTDFLRNILSSTANDCCKVVQILVSCTKIELDCIMNFLYTGTILCKTKWELLRFQNNISKIFGFPGDLFLTECFTNNEFQPIHSTQDSNLRTDNV